MDAQKIISGDITMHDNIDLSTSVLCVALLDDAQQKIETTFIQGDIIMPQKSSDTVVYSIPVDFEFVPTSKYITFAFLDTDNDSMNTDNDFVKSIQIENLTESRIQYFDINFSKFSLFLVNLVKPVNFRKPVKPLLNTLIVWN